MKGKRSTATNLLLLVAIGLLAPAAVADSDTPAAVTHDDGAGRVKIVARSRGVSVSLVIATEELAARKPPRTPAGPPIGWDDEWRQLHRSGSNHVRVFRAFELTVNGRRRSIPHRLTDRFVSPALASVMSALSSDGRRLFVCTSFGDGAGAALGLWSLALGKDRDRAWAGDLISEWEPPEIRNGDDCRAAGEAAPRIRTAARRWPIVIE